MKCKICGEAVDPRRVELGYDYCMRRDCQELSVERVELAAVAVNKASDQYVRADEVVPSGPDARWSIDDEPERGGRTAPRRAHDPGPARRQRPSTARRLERAGVELDDALMRLYERFCRSELTAAEMRSEQNALIRAFNDRVRRENIRYRSFLRKRV